MNKYIFLLLLLILVDTAIAQKPSDYITIQYSGDMDMYTPPVIFYYDSSFKESDRKWQMQFKDIGIEKFGCSGCFYCLDSKTFQKVLEFVLLTKLDPENRTPVTGLLTTIVKDSQAVYQEGLYSMANRTVYCSGIIEIIKELVFTRKKMDELKDAFIRLNYQ